MEQRDTRTRHELGLICPDAPVKWSIRFLYGIDLSPLLFREILPIKPCFAHIRQFLSLVSSSLSCAVSRHRARQPRWLSCSCPLSFGNSSPLTGPAWTRTDPEWEIVGDAEGSRKCEMGGQAVGQCSATLFPSREHTTGKEDLTL